MCLYAAPSSTMAPSPTKSCKFDNMFYCMPNSFSVMYVHWYMLSLYLHTVPSPSTLITSQTKSCKSRTCKLAVFYMGTVIITQLSKAISLLLCN